MFKLSSLQDFLGLISSISAAWPSILLVGGVALSLLLALPPAALIAISIVGILAAALLVYQLRHRFLYVALHEASRKAFEQLDGTVWAEAATRMHDEPSARNTLEYMGQLLVNDIALYGTRPPSTVFKRIDAKIVKRSAIKNNCETLTSNDSKELPWTKLAVERKELKRRIKEMKASDLSAPLEKLSNVVKLTLPKVVADKYLPERTEVALKEDNKVLEILRKMVKASDGSLIIVKTLEGTRYQVGNENINETFDARELAFLHEAMIRLERQGLIRLVNSDKTFNEYEATAAGYKEVEAPI